MGVKPEVKVVGRRLDAADHRLRDFLTRTAQPYAFLAADTPDGRDLLARHGATGAELPVVIEQDGTVTTGATVERIVEVWRLTETPRRGEYDLVIVGAGPAGLAAAVYAASDGLQTLLVERDVPGGQASHTSRIENFFGFPDGGIGGAELARRAGRQAEHFGAELVYLHGVSGHRQDPDGRFRLRIADRYEVAARIVIASPGMDWRRMEVDGVDALLGRGVYYGAGRSEAQHCAGDPVVVVGAGNSAGQAVMDLAKAGAAVTMLVRGDSLGRSMSAYLVHRIEASPQVDVRLHTQLAAVHGDEAGVRAVTAHSRGREPQQLPARAVFLCLGGVPRTGWAAGGAVATGPGGFLLTGPDLLVDGRRPQSWPLQRDPLALETSIPGLFAAGDVRHGSTKRVAGAVGDGAMAVALAHRRLEELEA